MSALAVALAGVAVAIALATLVALIVVALRLRRDPYTLVRAEYARQRRVLGLAARAIVVDGVRWVYAERAAARRDAPTVVMLHGYTGSKENWYRLAKRLRNRYRLIAPDLPGWSESQRDAGADYGYVAQAERVAAFLRAVCDVPVVLLGHSMGGGIAALVAARDPDLVARLGLLNAAGVRFADNRFGLEVEAGGNPFAVSDPASLERYLGIVFADRAARPPIPWPASRIVIAQRRREQDFEQSVLDRIGRGDEPFLPGHEAAHIRQPVLLLWGDRDQVIDPSAMALYAAQIPQARQVLLAGCGHMSLMERPDAVADAVEALIAT